MPASSAAAVREADPDLVLHLAAESHSNVTGTFQLLQAVRAHWEGLSQERRDLFRFHHISTDEVFGSLGSTDRFSEATAFDP